MLSLFAAALCSEFIHRGHRVTPYWTGGGCSREHRAFWDARAAEILPGVIAARLWRSSRPQRRPVPLER